MTAPQNKTQHELLQERAAAVDLRAYHLHLDLSEVLDSPTYRVTTRLELTSNEPELFLDYLGESVAEVRVNGTPQEVDFDGSIIRLHGLPVGEEIAIEVTGHSRYSRTGQGLHRMHDQADDATYLYSHLEPSDARRIFPCLEQPDLKAVFHVRMTAPKKWQILSNQPEVERHEEGELATVTFAPTPPLSTYLTSFSAGPYQYQERTWTASDGSHSAQLRAFARASMFEHLDEEILELTAQGMDFFHQNFGYPYPWGKYDSIFVPEYNLGAMENPGLVTFTENYIFRSRATRAQHAGRANTILHEMSHMWFGDLVTPQWWDDLWLKESFAEFMGADSSVHGTDYTEAWANFAGARKNWAYLQDQLPTTHPIKAEIPDVDAARQNFDGITYAKGAAVLKQLVHYVGRDNFYAGARDYFQEHAFAAATFDDLLQALKKHTDRDLDAWSQAWLRTWGPDTLTPELHTEGEKIAELAISADAEDVTRPHRLTASLFDASLHKYREIDIDLPAGDGTTRTIIDEAAGLPAPALLLLNDADHTYAKIRFDEASLDTASERLTDIEDELTRAVIWTALWNLTRDGEMSAIDYVGVVVKHEAYETNTTLLATACANANFAIARYVADADREQVRTDYAEAIWGHLDEAEPASDAQLVLARAAIRALAATPEESGTERLKALLSGDIAGLRLDPEIRWSILRALAARNAVTMAELEEEKQRDNTLTGATEFLGASHAFPTPETKRSAFDKALTPGAYSNAEVDALVAGFNAPRSASLQEAFAEEFFTRVEDIWAAHPIEIASRLIRGFYPELPMADATTTRLLHRELPGALRRILLECRDNLRRTLRVRAGQ